MPNNISNLGLQLNTISRIKSIQTQMSSLQEQIATGVNSQTYAGYGADAMRIQSYRSAKSENDSYLYNIEVVQTNIQQMDGAITETIEQIQNVMSAVNTQLAKGSEYDVGAINNAAAAALEIIKANLNTKVGDRYLFAGTDVLNAPYDSNDAATSNIQQELASWLDGTTATPDDFLTAMDGLTDAQLGYSTTLQTAKNIYAQADATLEVNYTVKADDTGFRNTIVGLTALANIQMPATGDVASSDDFYDLIDGLYQTLQVGVTELRNDSASIASASQVLNTMQIRHENDNQTYLQTMEEVEATDNTSAIVVFQTLQNQLEASYQVTSIISQLSLARILG